MLITEFIDLKLKEYGGLSASDIKKLTWAILQDLKSKHNIMYNDRTLDMANTQLDLVKHEILINILKLKRS